MKKICILFAAMCCVLMAGATEGALTGGFTVDAHGKQVQFSKGNLQYVGSWQFASNQWDIIGNNQSDNNRDLFGWGTGKAPNKVSTSAADYATYDEWGANKISNGGNADSLWYTLTKYEWAYLFHERAGAASRIGFGHITFEGTTIGGIILIPDWWRNPYGLADFQSFEDVGYTWTSGDNPYYSTDGDFNDNGYSADEWRNKMEPSGAVFLPAVGFREGVNADWVNVEGYYWSSTPSGNGSNAFFTRFNETVLDPSSNDHRNYGMAVRLVQDYTGGGTGCQQVMSEKLRAVKRIINGQIVIVRDGKMFNAIGQEIQ